MNVTKLRQKLRVSVALGTRPEAIKLLPVVRELRKRPEILDCRVIASGQHRELLDQVLEVFGVGPDADLHLMQPGQKLETSFARALVGMSEELSSHRPDILLVEGDTTTVFAGALAAFWQGCPVGHVEAGLRSGNVRDPFPEEMNRILTGCVADLHFAPTRQAAENLRKVGVPAERIHVTGNTVIDALLEISKGPPSFPAGLSLDPRSAVILVTVHRRESFGEPLRDILSALKEIARRFPAVEIVLPVHPNPQVHDEVHALLGGVPRIHLVSPLSYVDFVGVLRSCRLVLSDSGGVQEEAPALGKPVLVLRNTTERPEGVACGVARLVGTSTDRIVREAAALLEDPRAYDAMAKCVSPYGDGQASRRIVEAILHRFGYRSERPEDFSPGARGLEGRTAS
jgi:UDP-N-acetylglucosamine 2-epimerase (non-hydrolysing)